MFGAEPGATAALLTLCDRAGVQVRVPEGLAGLCCGTPWQSKGLNEGYALMRGQVSAAAESWRAQGATTVVCDASSCTEGLRRLLAAAGAPEAGGPALRVLDAVDFAADELIPRLAVTRRLGSVAAHPTCSSVRTGHSRLVEVAAAFADRVVVPDSWGCCGFAGDRGLLHPELTASATAAEAAELATGSYDAYVSDNRTCELGLSRATGRPVPSRARAAGGVHPLTPSPQESPREGWRQAVVGARLRNDRRTRADAPAPPLPAA